MNKYNKAIKEVLVRYENTLSLNPYDFTKHYSVEELQEFYIYFLQSLDKEEFESAKYSRWLGFIQGILVANGYITVEDERNLTRPLFKPLDTKHG